MKTITKVLFVSIAFIFGACGENNDEVLPEVTDQYAGMTDFYLKNGASLQSFTIDAGVGGTFVSAKGSRVEIPPDAFVTTSNSPVNGAVTIEFRDIYKKSDMILSGIPTLAADGMLLKSAGEFFIRAIQNNQALQMASGKKLDVFTPEDSPTAGDTAMSAFFLGSNFDPYLGSSFGWIDAGLDTVRIDPLQYVYSLSALNSAWGGLGWYNIDNPIFFTNYSQTNITIHSLDSTNAIDIDVYALFHSVKAVVQIYRGSDPDFHLNPAPQGASCTVVAIGVRNGKLYSSFVPTTIMSNQTVNFSLAATTTQAFNAQLRALD